MFPFLFYLILTKGERICEPPSLFEGKDELRGAKVKPRTRFSVSLRRGVHGNSQEQVFIPKEDQDPQIIIREQDLNTTHNPEIKNTQKKE